MSTRARRDGERATLETATASPRRSAPLQPSLQLQPKAQLAFVEAPLVPQVEWVRLVCEWVDSAAHQRAPDTLSTARWLSEIPRFSLRHADPRSPYVHCGTLSPASPLPPH